MCKIVSKETEQSLEARLIFDKMCRAYLSVFDATGTGCQGCFGANLVSHSDLLMFSSLNNVLVSSDMVVTVMELVHTTYPDYLVTYS